VVSFSGSLDVFMYRFGVSIWRMRKLTLVFHRVWVSRLDNGRVVGWVGYDYRRRKRRLAIHATTKPGHGGNGKRRGKMRDMK
jgi:hypothetical protein